MISKLKRISIFVLASCVMASGIAALTMAKKTETAQAAVSWVPVTDLANVKLNEELNQSILNRKVTIDGKEYDFDKLNVVYPDGSAVLYDGQSLPINQAGKYTFTYIKEIGDKTYSAEEVVYVKSKSITVGKNSTVVYDKGDKAEKETSKGLLFNLAKNEEIVFNSLIDVSDIKATNYDSEPLLSLYFNPVNAGASDVGNFWIVLSDSEDSSVTLTVQISHLSGSKRTVVKAGGENQVLTGLEGTANIHRGDQFGTYSYCSMASLDFNSSASYSDFAIMSIYYDSEDVALKIQDSKEATWSSGKINTVADFDSKTFFPTELWRGFPSGKVKMKMYASDWASPNAAFCVTSLYGQDDLQEYLNSELNDDEAPVIDIDIDEKYSSNMPEARLGDYYYLIPEASAYDLYSGKCDVEVSVLFENGITCKIKDGKFKTDKYGYYTIRYRSVDESGNEAKKELYVHCGGAVSDISVTFDEISETALCGETVNVPKPTIIGGIETNYAVKAYDETGETYDCSDGFVRAKNKGKLYFEYTITEKFTGYSKTETVAIETVDSGNAFLTEDIVLPKYFVSGVKYTLPEIKAYYYENDILVEKTVDVYMNGQKYAALSEYVPTVSMTGENVDLVFKCGSKTLYEKSVPAIIAYNAAGNLTVENYFVATEGNYTVKKEISGINFTSSADYAIDFARALSVSDFSLTMQSAENYGKFSRIEFTLADTRNEAKKVSFALVRNRSYYIEYNGTSYELFQDFDNGKDALTFTLGENTLKFGSNVVSLTAYADGSAFEGFPSEEINLTVKVNTNETSTLKIVELNGNVFSDSLVDATPPSVKVDSRVTGYRKIDEIVTIGKATVRDVLDPNVKVNVTVTAPDGTYATTIDGIVLNGVDSSKEYKIKLEKYGQYEAVYRTVDNKGTVRKGATYTFRVKDITPPTISFAKGFKTTGRVGETYVIPDYTVKDDVTSDENIESRVYILNPFDKIEYVEDKTYTFGSVGEYTIYIFAYDETYNYTFYTVDITVTR